MGYKLSDIYLFSDFDGTLHSATEGIPQRNLDALQRFVQKEFAALRPAKE